MDPLRPSVAVLNGAATADLGVDIGPRDALGISASRSHSRQPVETGSTLDLTSDQVALLVRHTFGTALSASIEAAHLRQESDDAGAGGTFEDNRVSIGVRWTSASGASQ